MTEVVKRDLTALRSVITDIYPPDLHEGGLVPASRLLVSEVRYAGVDVDMQVDHTVTDSPLPIDAAVLGYRVLRETLRNVTRHSGATNGPRVAAGRRRRPRHRGGRRRGGLRPRPSRPRRGTSGCASSRTRSEHVGGHLIDRLGAAARHRGHGPLPRPDGADVMIRVLVADDHEILRWGLVQSLSREPDLVVVGEVGDTAAAIEACDRLAPDVLLLDLSMPGGGGWAVLSERAHLLPGGVRRHPQRRRRRRHGRDRPRPWRSAHVSKAADAVDLADVLRSVAADRSQGVAAAAVVSRPVPAARRQRAAPAVATRAPADQPPSNRYCACAR